MDDHDGGLRVVALIAGTLVGTAHLLVWDEATEPQKAVFGVLEGVGISWMRRHPFGEDVPGGVVSEVDEVAGEVGLVDFLRKDFENGPIFSVPIGTNPIADWTRRKIVNN